MSPKEVYKLVVDILYLDMLIKKYLFLSFNILLLIFCQKSTTNHVF